MRKTYRRCSRKQAKNGEAIVALMIAGVLMLFAIGAVTAMHLV